MKTGNVVQATAGKEKGEIFVVVKVEGKFAFIADGKRISLFKPKKKNLKHIQKVSKQSFSESLIAEANDIKIDAEIRKFLKSQKETICQKKM